MENGRYSRKLGQTQLSKKWATKNEKLQIEIPSHILERAIKWENVQLKKGSNNH